MDAITQAREQLDGIVSAINREKLVLETATKDAKDANDKSAEATKKLADLNKQVETAEFALKATNEQVEDAKKALNAPQAALDALKSDMAGLAGVHAANLATAQAEVDKIKADGEQAKNVAKDELAKLETDIALAHSELNIANGKVVDLNKQADEITSNVKTLESVLASKQEELKNLEADVLLKQKTSGDLSQDIQGAKDKLNTIETDIKSLGVSKTNAENALATVNADLEAQKAERDGFVTAKFALAKATEELNQREAMIKAKYAQAGVQY